MDQALQDLFDHTSFRPLQREAVEAVLAGRSVLAVFATGGGKSLCYQLAGSLLPGVTLVFSPLVALMKDQSETRLAHKLKLTTINSHTPPAVAAERLEGLQNGTYKMLLLAPERLRNQAFVEAAKGLQVSLLVVDEAHCLSEWGHDFRPDYRLIRGFRESAGKPPVMALTATATPQVREDIKVQLGIHDALELVGSSNRPNISIAVHRLRAERVKTEEIELALRAALGLGQRPRPGRREEEAVYTGAAIVYVSTTRAAEHLAEDLTQALRLKVLPYHAKLPPAVRSRVQEAFMGGQAPVVVATNAFGMGLDKPDVRLVIHAGVPASLEAYYQEIGRAGRDGQPSRALLLYTGRDVDFRRWLLEEGRVRPDDVRAVLDALKDGRDPFPGSRPAPRNVQRRSAAGLQAGRRLIPRSGPDRQAEPPHPQEEAAATKVQAIVTELELQGLVRRQGRGPAGLQLRPAATDADLEQAVLRAGTLLDRLYRQRLAKFRKVEEFLTTPNCRREFLLRYFGEKLERRPVPCCDRCVRPTEPMLVGGLPRLTRKVRLKRQDPASAIAGATSGEASTLPPASAASGAPGLDRILRAGKLRDRAAVPRLIDQLSGSSEDAVLASATALGRIKDPMAEEPLRRLLSDDRPQVRRHAVEALGELGGTLETVLALEVLAAGEQDGVLTRLVGDALARVRRRTRAQSAARRQENKYR